MNLYGVKAFWNNEIIVRKFEQNICDISYHMNCEIVVELSIQVVKLLPFVQKSISSSTCSQKSSVIFSG